MVPDAKIDREYEAYAKEQARKPKNVKPLDLATLIRDAFLAGRGLKDGDKLSESDQKAWVEYAPERMAAYERVSVALYGHAV